MKKRIYLLVNSGDIEYASYEREQVEAYRDEKIDDEINEAAEECGRDIDDMTYEEIGEMAIMAAYEGEIFTAMIDDSENVPDDDEMVTVFSLEGGDSEEFSISEILEVLEKDNYEDDNSYFEEDEDFDEDFNEDYDEDFEIQEDDD